MADCLRRLKDLIQSQCKGKLAAVIAEPIQGTAGNIVPPAGFIRQIRDIAHENGAVYISDEMICGFGRTGKMFGCDHDGVEPDIMTIGKGMGSGFPVSGVVTTDELAQAKPWSLPSASSSSYGGNPLASAAARITIQTIADEKLAESSTTVGDVLLKAIKKVQDKYEFVGDVRGKGLLIGMDLVTSRKTKEKMPKAVCEKFFTECLKRGMIMMGYSPRVRIHPPLVLSEAEALEGVARIDEARYGAISREIPRLIDRETAKARLSDLGRSRSWGIGRPTTIRRRRKLWPMMDPSSTRQDAAKVLKPGLRAYGSMEELFGTEKLDFVDICTPPSSHAELAL